MASTEGIGTNVEVQFSIGLDTKMGEHGEFDEDGDFYRTGEITFGDIVAGKAAAIVAANFEKEVRKSPDWSFDPKKVAEAAIDKAVAELVASTLSRVVSQTDTFGQAKGEPQTIAEILSARIEKWLVAPSKPNDGFSRNNPSNIETLVSQALNRETSAAIKKATDEARTEVLARLKSEQTAALSGAVERLLAQSR